MIKIKENLENKKIRTLSATNIPSRAWKKKSVWKRNLEVNLAEK